ncbi:MCP methyltransferase, CheR-type with Tpr repeats [Oscillochloris trichoides DG-6]|uniref:MCP methyltransferase, CheR-type with Tpr repeats n=1 Tax=Oscillochloris trichoides DG-6 TaxID=765420 RepID=E1IGI2_9CHLR|nr:protein-glutamate O-methyltransferase CheR [Oscillochloris trichoides]EFO79748.1 MCP methyltransferase, CheR-type with Tpr repeats [Oscillochloris trichoides DG-6]
MKQPVAPTNELGPAHLATLRDLLATYCGVYLDDSRHESLRSAVRRRAQQRSLPLPVYAEALATEAERPELHLLAELLLNHETVFFRHRLHMAALGKTIIPELHQRLAPGIPIRIWSAGCATGEEVYSIAITALEALGNPPARPLEIVGSDLSSAALARARTGRYRGRTIGNLSADQRRRFFRPFGDDGLEVNEHLRRVVHFEQRNLLEPFPAEFQGMQIIFCQNVTIYFQIETCRTLMARFYDLMAEGGTLFLGFSETLWNIFNRFRWREVDGTYVYQKDRSLPAAAPRRPVTPAVPTFSTLPERVVRPSLSSVRPAQDVVTQGRNLIDAGKSEAALDMLEHTPLGGPQVPQLLALSAHAHANRGDLDLAAAEAHRALELDALTTEAHLLIGLIHARQEQPTSAIKHLERARYLDPNAAQISFHLAECYRQLGRMDAARREYRNTIQKLAGEPPERLIDGVAVGWLAETCQRYLTILGPSNEKKG